jgi:hypothetical protein
MGQLGLQSTNIWAQKMQPEQARLGLPVTSPPRITWLADAEIIAFNAAPGHPAPARAPAPDDEDEDEDDEFGDDESEDSEDECTVM